MRAALFLKTDKPHNDDVKSFLRTRCDECVVYEGQRGEPFPEMGGDDFDMTVSYISPWIIPQDILARTSKYRLNFHPGPPEYPGIGCFNFAIYEAANHFGVTAHEMEKKVDSGKIIGVNRFPMSREDSVYTLSLKTYESLWGLFQKVMTYIFENGQLPECDEAWTRSPIQRKELEKLCQINLKDDKEEIRRKVKATTYPGMPGAYVNLFGYKFEYNERR